MNQMKWGTKGLDSAKLTEEQAEKIIWHYKNGEKPEVIAKKFGVCPSTVRQYIRRHTACPWHKGTKMWMMHLGIPTLATITDVIQRGTRQLVEVSFEDGQTDTEEWFYFQVLHEAALKKIEEGKHETQVK